MQKQFQVNSMPDCKVCKDSHRVKVIYDMRKWRVYRCDVCGFVFIWPLIGQLLKGSIFDQRTVITHHSYRIELNRLARSRVQLIQSIYNNLEGLRILDIGCGNGYFLNCCKESGMVPLGIEINEAAAQYAKREFGIEVIFPPPQHYGAHFKEKFDIISLWGVIEHLEQIDGVLYLSRSLLNDNGVMIIQTPTEDAVMRKVVHLANRLSGKSFLVYSLYTPKRGGHIQCFSRGSIKNFLSRCGFSVLKIKDSTYGKKYMLKKPIFMRDNLSSTLLRTGAGFMYDCSKIIGHQNHMIVFAKKLHKVSI